MTKTTTTGTSPNDTTKIDPKDLNPGDELAKEIIPPETVDEEDKSDEDEIRVTEAADVPFEPLDDPKARMHGTHDGAMAGLQTDISGSYTPPGLVKQAEDAAAEEENQYRAAKAKYEQMQFARDVGDRRNRL